MDNNTVTLLTTLFICGTIVIVGSIIKDEIRTAQDKIINARVKFDLCIQQTNLTARVFVPCVQLKEEI